jgi:hypothetical protein
VGGINTGGILVQDALPEKTISSKKQWFTDVAASMLAH